MKEAIVRIQKHDFDSRCIEWAYYEPIATTDATTNMVHKDVIMKSTFLFEQGCDHETDILPRMLNNDWLKGLVTITININNFTLYHYF